jgi:hypothetical protein
LLGDPNYAPHQYEHPADCDLSPLLTAIAAICSTDRAITNDIHTGIRRAGATVHSAGDLARRRFRALVGFGAYVGNKSTGVAMTLAVAG